MRKREKLKAKSFIKSDSKMKGQEYHGLCVHCAVVMEKRGITEKAKTLFWCLIFIFIFLVLNIFVILFWSLIFLKSFILILNKFYNWFLTTEYDYIFIVSSSNMTKLKLHITFDKVFLCLVGIANFMKLVILFLFQV